MSSARIEIRVQPRSSRNEAVVDGEGRTRVYLTVAPEGGKANEAAIELLATRLGIAKSGITILRGHSTRNKLLRIDGLTEEQAMARLRA